MSAQQFTKIASEKTEQAKDAASKVKDKSTGNGKTVYDSVAANLQSARDKSAKQLEDTRAAADEQWVKLQKVNILTISWLQRCSPTEKWPTAFWALNCTFEEAHMGFHFIVQSRANHARHIWMRCFSADSS